MGGLGSHHVHSDAVQFATFVASLFLPGGVFALMAGAWIETAKRNTRRRAPATVAAPLSKRGFKADYDAA